MAQPDERDILLSQITVPTFTANVYTSSWVRAADWERVVGVVYSNQASIASGFKIEQSIDQSTILDTQTYTIAASTGTRVEAQVIASWFRVSFEHGGVAPTTFQLEAYGSIAIIASSLLGSSITLAGADAEDAAVVGDPVLTGGRYDASDRSLDDGDVGALAVTAAGEVKISIVASLPAGTAAIGKLAANSGVDIGDVDVTDLVPGTGATNLGKAEDAVHASGNVGVMALAVRNTILASLSGADGDYSPLQVDDNGALYQVPGDHIDMVSVAGTQATATSTSVISAPGAGKAIKILGGNFQQNAASPTNPQRIAIENGTDGAEKFVARLSANDGAGIGFSHPVIMSTNDAVHLDSDQADSFIWSLTYTIVDM